MPISRGENETAAHGADMGREGGTIGWVYIKLHTHTHQICISYKIDAHTTGHIWCNRCCHFISAFRTHTQANMHAYAYTMQTSKTYREREKKYMWKSDVQPLPTNVVWTTGFFSCVPSLMILLYLSVSPIFGAVSTNGHCERYVSIDLNPRPVWLRSGNA